MDQEREERDPRREAFAQETAADDAEEGMTPDQIATHRLLDLEFCDWLWYNDLLKDGPHEQTYTGRTFTAKAVALLWDVYKGHVETASEREAKAKAQRDREQAATVAAELEAKEHERRLADDSWRRGLDAASLRAACAWRRDARNVQLTVSDGPLRAALEAADAALASELEARERERRDAEEANRDPLRVGPAVPVPPALDLATIADPDAVARLLVGHAGKYELATGHWTVIEHKDSDGWATRRELLFYADASFRPVARRCAAWATYLRLEADAKGKSDDVRAHVRKALAPDPKKGDPDLVPPAIRAAIDAELPRWEFKEPRPPNPEQPPPRPPAIEDAAEDDERTEATARPRRMEMRDRVIATAIKFKREHRRWPRSLTELVNNVTGKRATVLRAVKAMVEDFETDSRGRQLRGPEPGREGYRVVDDGSEDDESDAFDL